MIYLIVLNTKQKKIFHKINSKDVLFLIQYTYDNIHMNTLASIYI